MKPFKFLFLLILSCLIAINVNAQKKGGETEIAPGIFHKKIVNPKDTLVINIIKINLQSGKYKIEAVKAGNLLRETETTSSVCENLTDEGYDVIAGINADFFKADGEIINNMISFGNFVKAVTGSPYDTKKYIYSQFALSPDNKPWIEQFSFNGRVIFNDNISARLKRINSVTDSASITLYNHFNGSETPSENNNYNSEVILFKLKKSGDTLFAKVKSPVFHGGGTAIPEAGYVLSGNNFYAALIDSLTQPGDTLKLLLQFAPDFGPFETLTGGWPRLIKDGKNYAIYADSLEGTFTRFSTVKHPRTGIGFSKDSTTFFMFTVDGRQESSSGMSLYDFADLMISEGVYQGLNLDGGGSTTMVIQNKVINNPSDFTGERAVGSSLLVIRKKK